MTGTRRPGAPSELVVLAGSSHPLLAQAIAAHLGVPLGPVRSVRFANDNLKLKVDCNVRDKDVFVVQTSCVPVNDHLVELLVLIDALRFASAGRITAVLPYYPYVRSDKKDEPRISITARLVADLLQTAGADRVLTLDLHSPQIQGFFRIPIDQLTAVPLLCDALRRRGVVDAVVVAPDAGEVKDAARVAKRLEVPLAIVDKRRTGDDDRARAQHLVGEVAGKRVLIVDDEIATGGTLFEAAAFVKRAGATSVSAAIVHPVLVGDAVARLATSQVDELLVTDSVPLPPAKADRRIQTLSVAPLLAEAIARIHDGESVSALFD